MTRRKCLLLYLAFWAAWNIQLPAAEVSYRAGVSKRDVTPSYPIRLSGYAARKSESEGIEQHLWVKALALQAKGEEPALLLTADNVGVPRTVREEVVRRLGLKSERVALCSSHAHSAPCLENTLPTLFGHDLSEQEKAHIHQYTRELADALVAAGSNALRNMQPVEILHGQGSASFAANRRTPGGPVDHDLPVLVIRDKRHRLQAILFNYACHCTTISSETNRICGDWATYGEDFLEQDFPGVTALGVIGCGADANPSPRPGVAYAIQHGHEIEEAVRETIKGKLAPLRHRLECRAREISLPFDSVPTRAEWEAKAQRQDYEGYYARHNLAKLNRGEELPKSLPYFVQEWNFGNDLAMVFLAGEVVVDYSLRLKNEFDASRLCVTAYANDVPCYIPSERILKEGGYEGGGAMVFYDKPSRLAAGIENRIVAAVHEIVPKSFVTDVQSLNSPAAKSPQDSLAAIRVADGYAVELAVAEPEVVDPVAIDWGLDGTLWVVEMRDYPMGMDGNWKPGSRIKRLPLSRHGRYEKGTVFLDNLPFATGVMAWGKGVLVCSAPDIIYAEDTNRDGKADVVKKIFSGFATENYQARVNSLSLGLDNFIYGANGLLGGVIHGSADLGVLSGKPGIARLQSVNIRGRDFRIDPFQGSFGPASGLTQQGRARDDWGNWFGCDNSTLLWHYPLPDHYIRRNPYVSAPSARVSIAAGNDPSRLFPISRTLERFNNPESANRLTSVCGLGFYRDSLLGAGLEGNAFLCEPVHNLVRRAVLKPNGVTFQALRAGNERGEFLASRDNWFRPVQVRTGPDGALWVVDMYRFVIEHPRWISAERLATLDVRAGADKGRIYRVIPKTRNLRPIQNLAALSSHKLVEALDSPNGTVRDLVHQALLLRGDKSVASELAELSAASRLPAVRVQALGILDGLGRLTSQEIIKALDDLDPEVRVNAIRLAERFMNDKQVSAALLGLAADKEPKVCFQLALSLGEGRDPRFGEALGRIAQNSLNDTWMRAAILSSARNFAAPILEALLGSDPKNPHRSPMINELVATSASEAQPEKIASMVQAIGAGGADSVEDWRLAAAATLVESATRQGLSLDQTFGTNTATGKTLAKLVEAARKIAVDENSQNTALKLAAIKLLGQFADSDASIIPLLADISQRAGEARLQNVALGGLQRSHQPQVAELLLANWKMRSPASRQACLGVLFSRDAWTLKLVDALTAGTVAPSEISPADRQKLLRSEDASVKRAALALWLNRETSRKDVLVRYTEATRLPGDVTHGAQVFAQTCTPCHAFRGQGYAVGPNLAPLADKPPADLLLAILDPNAAVEPRFVAYNVETRDGRSLSGIVSAETATTLTLVGAGGGKENILKSDVSEIRASGLSLMPEGFEQSMQPQDFADLIAYIKTAPRAFGSATEEQAGAARKKLLSEVGAALPRLVQAADELSYPGWLGQQTLAYCRQTQGQEDLSWTQLGVRAETNGWTTFKLAAAMGYASEPSGSFDLRINGKTSLRFNVSLTDHMWQSDDGKARMSYVVHENNKEDGCGTLLIEVDESVARPGEQARFEVRGSASNSQRWFGIYLLDRAQAKK